MIIAFCGHSTYSETEEHEKKILNFLEKRVGNTPCDFFLGEYGSFDAFCYRIAKKFKALHHNSKLMFITPYINDSFLKKHLSEKEKRFDEIIYPNLENIPPRYAISKRNRWIVEKADIIVAYVHHKFGGAYSMYRYAEQKKKEIYDITK